MVGKKQIELEYPIGSFAYLKTDPEQHQRIVTRITLSQDGAVYELSSGVNTSSHYGIEMTEKSNESIRLGIN